MIQTLVQCGLVHVLISTINRHSSAIESYGGEYAETIAWEYDPTTGKKGKILAQGEASSGSLSTHRKLVKRFEETGSFEEHDEDY